MLKLIAALLIAIACLASCTQAYSRMTLMDALVTAQFFEPMHYITPASRAVATTLVDAMKMVSHCAHCSSDPFADGQLSVEAYEEDKQLRLEVELPGVRREDVSVTVKGDQLLVQAQRRLRGETKQMERALLLPDTLELDKGEARLLDGLLTLTFPKRAVVPPLEVKMQIL